MSDEIKKQIADSADMIIRGYAFTRDGSFIRVVNLNGDGEAAVLDRNGLIVSTNMDEIEQALVASIWKRDAKYMEAEYA